jgi:hypothetical protein
MKTKELNKYVPKVHFELIPIKNLVSNQKYQRCLSKAHIRRTVENFDLRQINLVKVSRRDGANYIINGQHTVEAIATVSGSRNTPVWCMIYDDLDYTQEANVFANQQKYVKYLKPYEVFMANVEAGNDEQLIIKDLVESYKLRVTAQNVSGGICAISSMEHIYQCHGFHVLDRVLRLCVGTWEGDADSLSANMLKGVAQLVVAFGDTLKDDIFKEKVGQFSIRQIGRAAKERGAGTRGYAETMLDIYNKKSRKSLLKKSRLYITRPLPPKGSE